MPPPPGAGWKYMSGPSMMPLCHGWPDERSSVGIVPVRGIRSAVSGTDQIEVWPSPMLLPSLFQMSHELPDDGSVKMSGSMLPP